MQSNDLPMTAPIRQVLSIDFGELRPRIETLAQADGLRTGPWIRRLLERTLQSAEFNEITVQSAGAANRSFDGNHVKFTARLSKAESAALAERAAAAGLSQSECLGRLLLSDRASATPMNAAWVNALADSNHQLVGAARSLNQIARAVSSSEALTASDGQYVLAVAKLVRDHVLLVSKQLAELQSSRRSQARNRA